MQFGIVLSLGLLGTAIGSFLNVLAVRYNPDLSFFSRKVWGGRSHCPKCSKQLSAWELIPIVSWLWQKGKCTNCKENISVQYLLVEVLSGFIFFAVALYLDNSFVYGFDPLTYFLWIVVFSSLLLIALIDYRTTIIPNELNVIIFITGIVLAFYSQVNIDPALRAFVGPYALLFGWQESFIFNRFLGIIVPALFFLILILITKGRGMGGGDLKLGAALGAVFGWPDSLVIVLLSFIVGSLVVLPSILKGRKGRKDLIPFGPFLVVATFIVFFWGENIMGAYFSLFPLPV